MTFITFSIIFVIFVHRFFPLCSSPSCFLSLYHLGYCGLKVETHDLDQFCYIGPLNIFWKHVGAWHLDACSLPCRKAEVYSGIILPLFFVRILLAVIFGCKNSSREEVVASHNKHCQNQAYIPLSITDHIPLFPGKQVGWLMRVRVPLLQPSSLQST